MPKKQTKSGQNEGCISRRKDGTWVAVITVGRNPNGSQRRRSFYGKSRQEVAERRTAALSEIRLGKYIEPNKSTLSEWLYFWFNEYISNKVKLSTKVSYNTFITKHIKPTIGKIQLTHLRGDMVQKFYNDKLKDGRIDGKGGLNPKTIKNIHNMLHESLEQASKNGLIANNPCKLVTLPKITKKEMRVLSVEEQQKLLSIAHSEKLGVGIILTLFTGLRVGELLGLQWKDIDLKRGVLSVRQTINRLKNFDETAEFKTSIVFSDTKTLKSKRQIPLHPIMIDALKEYKQVQNKDKQLADDIYEDLDFVIANSLGRPIEPRTYQDFFHKLTKQAGIAKANFHCLRYPNLNKIQTFPQKY